MIPDKKNKEILQQEELEANKLESEQGFAEAQETAEKIEAVEIPKPSEVAKETRDKKGDGASPAAKAAKVKKIKAELLKNLPAEKVMKEEVESALKKNVRSLEKQRNRIMNNPVTRDFHKLNGIVQKLRELKHILADLAEATYEMLKNLWLKFVHDIY
jgi:hypothetical protein